MNNILTINNTKANTLTFDVEITGGSSTDVPLVWFNIQTNGIGLQFACKNISGNKWEVTIPPLPFVEKTSFPCSVTVVADDYHFTPMNGSANIIGSTAIYTTDITNKTLSPSKPATSTATNKLEAKPEVKPEIKSEAKVGSASMNIQSIKHIADSLMKAEADSKTIQTSDVDSLQLDKIRVLGGSKYTGKKVSEKREPSAKSSANSVLVSNLLANIRSSKTKQ